MWEGLLGLLHGDVVRRMRQPERLDPRDVLVGHRAGLVWAGSRHEVEILEDLGAIGVHGRRLVRVRVVSPAESPPLEFDVPAELLVPLDDSPPARPSKRRLPRRPRLPA